MREGTSARLAGVLALALASAGSAPAQALFTRQVAQAEVSITAWSGCNPSLFTQQLLALTPVAYLRMQPTGLTEPDLGVSGGSWKWTSAPPSAGSALTCDANPAAAVTPATVLSSEGTDAVTADSVPFSYSLWLKAAPGAQGVVFASVAGLASTGSTARADRALFLRADGTVAVAMSDGPSASVLTSTTVVADNLWHLVTVALKINDLGVTRGLRLYVDGAQAAYSNNMRKGLAPAVNESWRLGPSTLNAALGAVIPAGSFSGAVDEIAVWDRTLTDAEIATLWSSRNG